MHRTRSTALAIAAAAAASLAFCVATLDLAAQSAPPFAGMLDEHPAIGYAQRATHDPVARVARAIAGGTLTLSPRGSAGYLQSTLDALEIAADSQLLVFSKTGVQRSHTGSLTPRALYFNDSVVVGFIPGAPLLEIASHDPEQGVVFYTIDQTSPTGAAPVRRTNCLACHVSASTLEVPGLINRNVFTRADGSVIPQLGSNDVNHTTPLLQRWGGMYVTGNYPAAYSGRKEHGGNVTVSGDPADASTTSNEGLVGWLASAHGERGYPSNESDIVPLLVFDHQVRAINLLTRLNWEWRVDGRWREVADELADYFLFVGETAPPARLAARGGFAERFAAAARQDRRGRSLRDFDLDQRLLRYPCSYMIYAPAFDRLPARARERVYDRLWMVLAGRDQTPRYAHLTPEDRRAIAEILRDTKTDLTATFRDGD